MKTTRQLNVKLPDRLYKDLSHVAVEEGSTMTSIVMKLVTDYVYRKKEVDSNDTGSEHQR